MGSNLYRRDFVMVCKQACWSQYLRQNWYSVQASDKKKKKKKKKKNELSLIIRNVMKMCQIMYTPLYSPLITTWSNRG